ncbi:translocation/assembly module TamB domain-containing protein [Mastigocoleus sp. MO_188.B34]|uniref:translocation/assembly module TamB domain-containing protein n=1 Tax=Mastigocoleus sp. MO_188.B34 TaxID=3036635 RepID=UPI002605EB06|nr:translocation/assembly module TamB domain-containing protein [Mastigocoleus sp. MO_188.B34]MDJ0695713.1 translocation/assembly module TamB domain-containing protein [Mastigocoleus sp. MO_188.B34]
MTSPNSPDEADFQEPQNQNDTGSWFRKIALATGIALVGMGTVGYFVTDFWIRRELPSLVETQLGNFLNRKVDIGEVQNWSLTGIRFSSSSLPATTEDPNQVSITTVDVNFNPIPVIFSRTLPVDITLIKPKVYLQQGNQGEWSRFDLALEDEGELPVKLDTTLRVRDAKVSLLPRGYKTPLESKLNGSVNYSEVDSKHLLYDLDAEVFQGKVKVKGKTQLENGETLANAKIEKLTLAKLNPFLPQVPLNISNGEFYADLKIELPTFSDLPLVVGTANLQKLKVKSKQLPVSINADAVLRFAGQKVSFEKAKGSYGSLTALLSGDMDLNKGFNLKVDVNPFGVRNVLKTVPVKLPVGIDGKLRANMALKGKFDNPILTGNIFSGENVRGTSEDSKSATDTIIVDKAKFSKINASFVGDLSQFLLKEFRATPISGGEVVAKGNVKFPQRLTEVKHLEVKNLAQSQLAFNVNANLSNPGATIAPYGVTNDLVKLSEITAVGSARGTLQNPQAVLSWKLPNADTAVVGKVSGAGDILYAANKVSLRNTTLETEDGKVNVDGEANLANNIWQGSVNANALSLTPLLSKLQQSQTSVDVPLFLERGNINLAGKLDNFQPASIDANAKLDLNVNGGKVAVDGVLNRGIILANASTNRVSLNKFLPQLGTSVTLADIRANASGSLQQLLSFATNNNQKNQSSNKLSDRLNNKLNSFRAVTSGKLIVSEKRGRGTINFNGRGDLGSETWEASINANSVTLNPFLSGFQSPQLNLNRPINLRQGKVKLAGNLDILDNLNPENIDLAKVQAIANLDLDVNNGKVAIDSKLERGLVEAIATAKGISVSPFLPDLPVPVTIADSQVNFSGSVNRLLSQGVDNIRANAIARLGVQGGTVNTVTKLNNGIFSSNTTATNINTPAICQNFDLSCPEVGKLSGKFNLAGNINPFIKGNSPATIQAKTISLQAGEQSLTADGQISLNPNLTTSKNVTWGIGTNLNVNARSNLNKLPSTLIARFSEQTNIPIAGNAAFQGRFQSDNLLGDPLAAGNLQLTGNLQLRDFAVDKIAFEPLLKGSVNLQPGKTLAINLQGQKDQISAQLEPCVRKECILPYLPVSFNLQQGENSNNPILVSGQRNDDRFNIDLKNFSLALLNVLPAVQENLPARVGGIVTGKLDLNLFDFTNIAGNLQVNKPSIGYIKAKEVAANFSYNAGIANVPSAYLELGQSRYNLQGELNLNSGDVNAKIFTKSAKLEDIFATINAYRLEDLQSIFFGSSNFTKAAAIETDPVGKPNAPLARQFRLLRKVDQRIREYAARKREEESAIRLDLRGEYDAQIDIAGKFYNPQVDFQLDGNNWEWRPQPKVVTVNPRKGPVVREGKPLNINQVTARGNYKDGSIKVDPLRVALEEGTIAFKGELTGEKTSGFIQVQNFSLDNLKKFAFIDVPVDIGGKVNLQAKLDGTIAQPQIQEGKISLIDGSFNQDPLGTFAGTFSYVDSVAKFNTTPDSFTQINAKIPYPPQPNTDNSINLDAKIGTQGLAFLSTFTQGQLEWVKGNGEIALNVEGPLNWSAQTPPQLIKDLAGTSRIQIENATVKTKQLGEEINLNVAGDIALQNQNIQVNQLEGNFAGSPFSLTGSLPLVRAGITNPDSPNSLILALGPGKLNLEGLYKGNVNANLEVSQTVTRPIIGGNILLSQGRVIVPKLNNDVEENQKEPNKQQKSAKRRKKRAKDNYSFEPIFKDLEITIGEGFKFKRSVPRTNFLIAGNLTLNGPLNNLQPQGVINLRRGSIYFLDNSFFLSRDREHFIVFSSDQGLFNPYLDMELQTIVVDAPTFDRPQPVDSEIRDDAIAPTNSDQIDVRIGIEGEASQLIGSLDNSSCQINSPPVSPSSSVLYSPERLKQIEDCINKDSRVAIQNQDLLNNPIVELTSTPNRNQTEILSLLGNRTVAIVKEVEQKLAEGQEEELIRSAFVDYVVLPIADDYYQEFLWNVQRPVNSVGKKIGLTRLQVFPSVTGLKDINENSSVRFIYNYDFGEFRVEYQRRF